MQSTFLSLKGGSFTEVLVCNSKAIKISPSKDCCSLLSCNPCYSWPRRYQFGGSWWFFCQVAYTQILLVKWTSVWRQWWGGGQRERKGLSSPGVDYHKLLRRPTWEAWVSGFPTMFSLNKLHHNKQQLILSVLEFGASCLSCYKVTVLRSRQTGLQKVKLGSLDLM